MTVKITVNGYIKISDIVAGYWVEKMYMFYTLKEAKKAFKKYVKEVEKYN